MKKKLFLIILTFLLVGKVSAQKWSDVTKYYIQNAKFENGSTEGWDISYNDPTKTIDGAVEYKQKYFQLSQSMGNLPPGKYRIIVHGFNRFGTASEDYTRYINGGDLAYGQRLELYAGGRYHNLEFPCVSAGAQEQPLGNINVKLANGKYVPSSLETAKEWFDAGYYKNVLEFSTEYTSPSSINVYKWGWLQNDWAVLGSVSIEIEGEIVPVESLSISENVIELVLTEEKNINNLCAVYPDKSTIKKLIWTSENEDIVTVDNENGVLVAKNLGETTVMVRSMYNEELTKSVKVIVKQADAPTAETIHITELMPVNNGYKIDPSGNYGSWMEIYNSSDVKVGFDNFYVTDDLNDLKKSPVKYPINFIAPKSFAVIWFDHHDDIFSPAQMNFKLNYAGGTIYITDGKKVITSVEYPESKNGFSYAQKSLSSDEWGWTELPTPGAANATSTFAEYQLDSPKVEEDGGFYTGEKQIHVSIPEGAYLAYTTDGTMPKKTSSPIKGKTDITFTIKDATKVYRFRAFRDGYLPSEVVTRTYIYKDKNYVFPTIAVTSDPENLTGNEYGIFVEGWGNGRPGNGKSYNCNWNADWDRPVTFEYITENNEYALNQEVNISTCGGWSRSWEPHSFKLKAAKYYNGLGSMDYQFFNDKPYLKHKVLQIRNGGNDTENRILDAAVQEVVRQSGINVNTQAWQPVHVFMNGKYQTVLNMREPNNKHFAYSNYGFDTDSVDQFEMSPDSGYVQKEGTEDKYLELYELSANAADPDTYSKICELLDIDEYINYMAVEFYIKNKDWPQNNVKGFRNRNNGKFHFVLFDLDQQNQVSGNPFSVFAAKKNYTFDYLYGTDVTPWATGDKVTEEIKFVTIFLGLLENETFRKQFIDTYCIIGGSVFYNENVKTIVSEMRNYLNKGMSLTGESCSVSANQVISRFNTTYYNEMISYLKGYTPMGLKSVKSASVNLKSNIEEGELFVNGIKVPTGSLTGTIYLPATVRAVAPIGYKFLGWSRLKNGDIVDKDIELELTTGTNRYYARWEKLTDEEIAENGITTSPVVINEVSAANDIYVSDYFKKSDWIELYNQTSEDIDIRGMYLSDNIAKPMKYQIPVDDVTINTVLPAHGYKLIWCDKKANKTAAIHADFKLDADGGAVMLSKYEDSDILYSDTLNYEVHSGIQSYGRYPDGLPNGYLMNKPTPGSTNIGSTDAYASIRSIEYVTNISDISVTNDESGIQIAYVGNNQVNVKSQNSMLKNISVYSASGFVVLNKSVNSSFETISLSDLPVGIYVVKVTDSQGKTATHKLMLK
ncbi:MAG: CotH kinase family protein [Bacteroidaceae bacterium]|nr:CotH kinase family protein [Bacteroidaceae bacterium]